MTHDLLTRILLAAMDLAEGLADDGRLDDDEVGDAVAAAVQGAPHEALLYGMLVSGLPAIVEALRHHFSAEAKVARKERRAERKAERRARRDLRRAP